MGCCLMIFSLSCDNDPAAMSAEEIYAADTLFTRLFPKLREKTDSLCQVASDTMYQHIVDSLTGAYMKEIDYLLKDHIIQE